MKKLLYLSMLVSLCACCTGNLKVEDGVSAELAEWRKTNIKDLTYDLKFSIPEALEDTVRGSVTISFTDAASELPQIDFKAEKKMVKSVTVNDAPCNWKYAEEHILISKAQKAGDGKYSIHIEFDAPDQSLNRRKEFLYTLLVPDRARTLFPCFDQPDMKANYTLELFTPKDWTAVSNTSIRKSEPGHFVFGKSEPLSTYLFSFVAGKFEKESGTRNGRTISVYHRETDPKKTAQIPDIIEAVFESLAWLEDYTKMDYPFEKYDCIIIPGFQFGGMEHTGATLYNTGLFLSEDASLSREMSRYSLIAHETAHMWFGDCVTMKWFDEVWTKEVFANYFAAKIKSAKYKDVSNGMTLAGYARTAYAEDRTEGAVPIKQQLDNMKYAGLVYGQIIYNKSPFVMEMLAERLGEEKFRQGIIEYLNTYKYGNATWNDLITIFDNLTDENLTEWSHNWVEVKGMPVITSRLTEKDGKKAIEISQKDRWDENILRTQHITYRVVYADGTEEDLRTDLTGKQMILPLQNKEVKVIFPNSDARAYGYFVLENPVETGKYLLEHDSEKLGDVFYTSALGNLNENYLNEKFTPEEFEKFLYEYMKTEKNQFLFSQASGYYGSIQQHDGIENFDKKMLDLLYSDFPKQRIRSFYGMLESGMKEESTIEMYYQWFLHPETFTLYELKPENLTSTAYSMAIRKPEEAEKILSLQRSRITNPDRLEQFDFVSKAALPDQAVRDSVFNALLKAENRRIEPWASSTLSMLNHRLRHEESVKYLRPGLEALEEVQATGDIFFTGGWISSLLSGHTEEEKMAAIESFLADHPDYPQMLKNKILLRIRKK